MASRHIRKYPVPGDFQHLLHDFTREVLRSQPENIYEFGVAYFTAMENGEELRYGVSESQMEVEMAQEQQQQNNLQVPEIAPGRGAAVGIEPSVLLEVTTTNWDSIMATIAQMAPELQARVKARLGRLSPELAECFMAANREEVEANLTDL